MLVFSALSSARLASRGISAAIGRELVIESLRPRLAWPLTFEARGLELANASWGSETRMLRVRSARFSVRLLPLLTGKLSMPQLSISSPKLVLEKGRSGEVNWKFGEGDPGGKSVLPEIGKLSIDEGFLIYRDPARDTEAALEFFTSEDESGAASLHLSGKGSYEGMRLSAEGQGGSLLSILDRREPYPLDLSVVAGATRASIRGEVSGLTELRGIEGEMSLSGATMSALFPLLGIALPPTRPYSIEGRLLRQGPLWSLGGFTGRVGESDLSGDFEVEIGGDKPRIRAKLVSKNLDMADLEGFVGAPETRPADPESRKQAEEAREEETSPKLIPTAEWRLERLRSVDAEVQLSGARVQGLENPITALKLRLSLRDGVAELDPLDLQIADGEIISKVRLDASKDLISAALDADFKHLRLGKLVPLDERIERSAGIVGGRAKLSGTGNSPAALLASADGKLGVVSKGGAVSSLIVQALQLHVGDAALLLLIGDEQAELRCLASQFAIEDGVARSDFFVVDTEDSTISIEGELELGGEKLDLTVFSEPKTPAVLSIRSPIRVTGRLKDPNVYPAPKELLLRGGIAGLLGLVNPLVSLVALVDIGAGEDQPCQALVESIRRSAGVKRESLAPAPSAR